MTSAFDIPIEAKIAIKCTGYLVLSPKPTTFEDSYPQKRTFVL
jgi:hypothetical protein